MMSELTSAEKKLRVAILDDHQGVLDGYGYRLGANKNIDLVGMASYGDELETLVSQQPIDVLLLDVSVPATKNDPHPYPILFLIPQLRKQYPAMAMLVISMHKQRTLIKAVMDAGARGYILKDDNEAIKRLDEIVGSVAAGGVYLSDQSYTTLHDKGLSDPKHQLTPRQVQALSLYAANPDRELSTVAAELNITPSTLRNLLSGAYKRLKVRNLAAAVLKARQLGLITPFPGLPDDPV